MPSTSSGTTPVTEPVEVTKKVLSSMFKVQSPRIFLIGYMGSGKTSALKHLANKMSWQGIDLDKLFEEKYKISVQDFFHKYDEAAFRKLESQLLKDTINLNNVIIATGGGTPCFFDNMEWMNENGTTVFLKVAPMTAVHRLMQSKKKRPLIEGKTEQEVIDFVNKHYGDRMKFYEQAHITVKGESLDVEELVVRLQDNETTNQQVGE